MEPFLLDTGFVYALLNQRESRHEECVDVLSHIYRPIVTCEAVVAESCYLLRNHPAGREVLLRNIHSGLFEIPFRIAESAPQVLDILKKYRDTPADYADACLIHLAELVSSGDILTLDSDFRHYRWRRNRAFKMLIPLD